jgi:hypothetical protein
MSTHAFFIGLCHSPIPRRVNVTLVALAWGGVAVCGEMDDAAI